MSARREAVRTDRAGENRSYEYVYNAAGEMTQLIDNQPPRPDNVTGATQPRRTRIDRDVAGRPTTVNESWDGGRDTLYKWQVGGLADDVRVDGILRSDGSYDRGRRMDYDYDNLDRLSEVKVNESGSSQLRSTRMTYWPSDERRELTKTNATVEVEFPRSRGQGLVRPRGRRLGQ